MNSISQFLAAALILICFSCTSTQNTTAPAATLSAADLQPYGRYLLHNRQQLELVSSAVHFGFTFEGTEAQVYASIPNGSGHNYLQYELDGVYQKRIKISGNAPTPLVLTAPTAGKHTVWVYKATEAHTGPILIHKITGNKVQPVAKPAAPLIEFIGNSITCGAAADPSEVPCGTGEYHDQHNAYAAYGPRVASAVGADFVLSSVSGIGVYRNWNSAGPTMPQVYEQADFRENSSSRWDFDAFTPQVVSIALGTNDFSNGDGMNERLPFDSTAFVTNYVQFVQLVKTKYPQAQIALLSSPMLNGNSRATLQNCLTAVKAQIDSLNPADKPVEVFFFRPMQASGCTGHPNVEDHAVLAAELAPFFRKLLNK